MDSAPTEPDPAETHSPERDPAERDPAEGDPVDRDPAWFRPALVVVVAGALVLRVVYVLAYRRHFDPHGDAYFYHAGANLLAEGKGFKDA